MPKPAFLHFFSAINGFTAVALGALGAHALKEKLTASGNLDSWQTASSYQLAHAVAGLAVLAWAAAQTGRRSAMQRIAMCWLLGSLLFSGSIYALSLGAPRFLGPVTPLGGIAFLVGWVLLTVEAFRRPAST
jgi:Uncharacterized small membrane protein